MGTTMIELSLEEMAMIDGAGFLDKVKSFGRRLVKNVLDTKKKIDDSGLSTPDITVPAATIIGVVETVAQEITD